MSVLAPLWLFALLPWAGVAVWLLRGRLKKVDVPFLELWKGERAWRGPRRTVERPPVGLAAALVAMLLAVLAAARPVVRVPFWGPEVTVIVDRGVTMSGREGGEVRFRSVAMDAHRPVIDAIGPARAELRYVPALETRRTDIFDWAGMVQGAPATAVDTKEMLAIAVARALRETEGVVVVVSDQLLQIENERLVRIAPEKPVANVGIVRFAVRERPVGQAMVRVRNRSLLEKGVLKVTSDDREVARLEVALPVAGERDYFVDLPSMGRVVGVEMNVEDELDFDDRAWVVRERAWPRVEARAVVPAEVGRMIESYSALRPATKDSTRVAVVTTVQATGNDAAVVLAASASRDASNEPVQVTAHPVTKSVQSWPAAMPDGAPLGDNWTPLVTRGGGMLLAARTDPVRQVWLGVHSSEWAGTTDFVILWTNILNWVGEGGERWVSHPIAALGEGWSTSPAVAEAGLTPGVYRREDGALRAVNAMDVRVPDPVANDWRAELMKARAAGAKEQHGFPLAPVLVILALAALCVAAVTWPRRPASSSLTPFSAARTL